jgi:hypothetical protein
MCDQFTFRESFLVSRYTLLLMSGFCTATALLTPDNIREVLDLTFPYRAKWRLIGIQLDIDVGTLDAIEANRRRVEDRLTDLISHWLRNTVPKPTRGALTAVFQSQYCTSGKAYKP